MPGRVITSAAEPEAAIDKWLLDTAGMPAKLHARLRREGGIQWKGDRLRLALFPYREAGIEPAWQELEVLFEDDFCLVVHKPAGMAVHPDGSGTEVTLDHVVAAHFAASGGGIAVRHIHRLDKDTTGPVLYAKNEYAQLALDEDMRAKAVSRLYAAVVEGIVPPELKVIDAPIGRDRHHAARRRVSPGGQAAVTRIMGREVLRGGTVLKVQLETGRTHQIRVHLSHLGHPLYGDALYGGPPWSAAFQRSLSSGPTISESAWSTGLGRLDQESPGGIRSLPARSGSAGSSGPDRQALHGVLLAFSHPWTREPLEVADPWPEDLLRLRKQLGGEPQA
ncbi:RluA family pseudouridine synthase [Paenibacillus jilunlii]|nr:RluA family pseudouridine synthase [Paenibacillus jilunlii]KWX77783.1 pseudouridine synthase [Paenibacillus jilunlii]